MMCLYLIERQIGTVASAAKSNRMSISEYLKFENDVEQIEAKLGDEHVVRMLKYLTSDSPEASQGLMELHLQCQEVISKFPPVNFRDEKKKTESQGTLNHGVKKRVD
ncbi:hypothetical protein KIN20_000847 [Parelaphostrongylus tenuis]|uniref:Uncharacterized protein n=1 Tax=Parelaphostrongylus tenuis TaxID=148309 RepID=A0AAD5LT62_PARTN|nr:hypothetical protein KIN20_000847 [Parelaphostrongylus tenuis]